MMQINILAFGIAKDIVGGSFLAMELEKGTTVGKLKKRLTEQFPDFARLASLAIAVNTEYVDDETILRQSDEIVIIPPVSGG